MVRTKEYEVKVAECVAPQLLNDWYPLHGTSDKPIEEELPHLHHAAEYRALTDKVRKRIKAEARKAGRVLTYSVDVDYASEDPTAPVLTHGLYLVATIRLK